MERPGTTGGAARSRPATRPGLENMNDVAARLQTPMFISDRALPPENETIRAIQQLLHIPAMNGRTEDEIVAETAGPDGLVTDLDFIPGVTSLFPNPEQPPGHGVTNVVWRRVAGALYLPTGKAPKVLQGTRLRNHSFLGALAAVAARQDLLLDLIVSDERAPHGVYTFQFYKHGCWQRVVVDNYLPCVEGEDRLAFACSGHVGELWPSFLEKGYAKVHGSFYGLEGGSVAECLTDLTGGVAHKVRMDAPGAREEAVNGTLWHQIIAWLSTGSVVACKAKASAPLDDGDEDGPLGGGGPTDPLDIYSEARGGGAGSAPYNGPGSEDPERGPGGILLNHVYSILAAREINGGQTRLLRMHCPWPAPGGVWHGGWAAGTAEWNSSEEAAELAAELAVSMQDEATFWMSYDDFVDIFNRLYVARMFPPHWHQLTLHCGWQGPSAGGPYYVATTQAGQGLSPLSSLLNTAAAAGLNGTMGGGQGGQAGFALYGNGEGLDGANGAAAAAGGAGMSHQVSSTWCCNPQFRLSVRKACEVVVSLGQQDPRVEARGHVRKAARRRSIGMMVLRVPTSALGRRWEVRPGELLVEAPMSAGREVVVSFRAEPGAAYVVVPYAGQAGQEGAFVLRTFSGAPLEVEQLPSPLSLVLGGQWAGLLAGGPRPAPTWGSNPQYMVSVAQRTQVVISVVRLDVRYAVLKPAFAQDLTVGLYLCTPERGGADGLAGRRTAIRSDADIVAEAGWHSMEEAVMQVTLEPATPYVLVPAIGSAGVEAPFELRIMSGVPVELVPLPELKVCVMQGAWRDESAGGCDLHPTWRKNPRYLLALASQARTKVTLSRGGARAPGSGSPGPNVRASGGSLSARARGHTTHVDDMLGFYVLRASDVSGAIKGDLRKSVLAETAFVTTPEVGAEYDLQPGVAYVIIPCTYGPGRTGRFTLAVSAPCDFDLREL